MTDNHASDLNPYRPPASPITAGAQDPASYAPGTVSAWASMALLYLSCSLSLATAGLTIWFLSEMHNGRAAGGTWFLVQNASLVSMLLMMLTGGFFAAWFHRKHKNLLALGARDLRFTPGWSGCASQTMS